MASKMPLSYLTIRTHLCHQELRQRERKNKALLEEVKTDEWNLENRKENIPNGDVMLLCAAGGRFEADPFFFLSLSLGFFFFPPARVVLQSEAIKPSETLLSCALCAKQTVITVSGSR